MVIWSAESDRERERLIIQPVTVFSITKSAMDHLSVSMAHWYFCHNEMKLLFWETQTVFFWTRPSLSDTKQTIQSRGLARHLRIKTMELAALMSGAFNIYPGNKSTIVQSHWYWKNGLVHSTNTHNHLKTKQSAVKLAIPPVCALKMTSETLGLFT